MINYLWNHSWSLDFNWILISGDYSEDDIYHYATSAAYQLGGGSPPPPAPPSPPLHAHPRHIHGVPMRGQQKGFSAVVYQPPSLHEVDAPNVSITCYYYYYKLTQSPNGEQITISRKTQWGSESTGGKRNHR